MREREGGRERERDQKTYCWGKSGKLQSCDSKIQHEDAPLELGMPQFQAQQWGMVLATNYSR